MSMHEQAADDHEIGALGPDFLNEIELRRFHGQMARHGAGEYIADSEAADTEVVCDEMLALLSLYAISRKRKVGLEATLDEVILIAQYGTAGAAERIGKTKVNLENRRLQVAKQIGEVLGRLMNGEDVEVRPRTPAPRPATTRASSGQPKSKLSHARPVSHDLLTMHYQETRHDLLNAEDEVELAKAIEAGLYAGEILKGNVSRLSDVSDEELEWLAEEGMRAKEYFITHNMRLAQAWVGQKRPTDNRDDLADRIQEGYLGVIRAVEKFDYQKGYKFSTYARWWIQQSVDRGRTSERTIRLPVEQEMRLAQLAKERGRWYQKHGHEATNEELSKEVGFDVAEFERLTRAARTITSLHTPLGDNLELIDVLAES